MMSWRRSECIDNKVMEKAAGHSSLIFLHIPKSAGTTFHDILERNFDSKRMFSIDGLHPKQSIQEFKEMSINDRSNINLLKGHMPFGLHEYIPSPATYITFIRSPVDRVISYYFYVLRSPKHYLYKRMMDGRMSLLQFIESRTTTEVFNFQVKLIAGVESAMYSLDDDDSLLEKAFAHIDKYFSVVGLTEYFDQSLLLMRNILGWKFWPVYKKKNVTQGRMKTGSIDGNIIELIKRYNTLDCTLYERTLAQFSNELRSANITDNTVFLFRMLNRFYNITRFGRN